MAIGQRQSLHVPLVDAPLLDGGHFGEMRRFSGSERVLEATRELFGFSADDPAQHGPEVVVVDIVRWAHQGARRRVHCRDTEGRVDEADADGSAVQQRLELPVAVPKRLLRAFKQDCSLLRRLVHIIQFRNRQVPLLRAPAFAKGGNGLVQAGRRRLQRARHQL